MIRSALVSLSILAVLPAPAVADPFPAAFQVSGVAGNDVLNIRAEPDAAAPIVGELGPYQISVEVLRLSDDGNWGLVPLPEGKGWVSMRFLQAMPSDPYELPRPLTCIGTEPFWSLAALPRGAEWSTPEEPRADLTITEEGVAPEGYRLRAEEGPTRVFHLSVLRQQCSDGMSDREFGFAAQLFVESPEGNRVHSGCCTLNFQ
jgi:uncharacterized membrane protein